MHAYMRFLNSTLTLSALFTTNMLQGWHKGERAIQKKLGYEGPMAMAFTWIEAEMPEQHRTFHTTRLPFIPVTTLDAEGRPWSCILAGSSGEPGFVSSPREDRLDMDVRVWEGDPFKDNINLFEREEKLLIAGIGIEFSTRRRNKFAGYITDVRKHGDTYQFKTTVNQAIGCASFICGLHNPLIFRQELSKVHQRPRPRTPS